MDGKIFALLLVLASVTLNEAYTVDMFTIYGGNGHMVEYYNKDSSTKLSEYIDDYMNNFVGFRTPFERVRLKVFGKDVDPNKTLEELGIDSGSVVRLKFLEGKNKGSFGYFLDGILSGAGI